MAYDITKFEADLESIAHGTTINQVTNPFGLINRAGRQLLMELDPQETKRLVNLGAPLFNNVYDYPAPPDLKGNKVIDIRPQVRRSISDQFTQTYDENFDVYKNKKTFPIFATNFNKGVKTLRISQNLLQGVTLNLAESITDNGTWTTSGDATDLVVDNINFVVGTGSLRFELDGSGTQGALEVSDMAAVNLTPDLDQGVEFCEVYMPYPDKINTVTLRWGSSATDYWENTTTETWANTSFETGWNQLGFNWQGATVVGSPDVTSVTYLKIIFDYDGSVIPNMRINGFYSQLGRIYDIEYYSKYLFRDASTGEFKETVTSTSDLINLDTETYNVLLNLAALLMAQQLQGADSNFDATFFKDQYERSLARYKAMYKSELIKPKIQYYVRTNNNYRRWFGTGPMGGTPQ